MMVSSLRTSLCMLSVPGDLPRLRNLTILMNVSSQYWPQDRDHHKCPFCNHPEKTKFTPMGEGGSGW